MASRTTDEAIQKIIDVETGDDLTPFKDASYNLVTQCCTGLDTEYAADHLVIIETWLVAHFYAQYRRMTESEKADVVGRKFESKIDLGLNNTRYGQMAMTLDYQGGLAALNKDIIEGRKKVVSVTWMGTEDPTDTLNL